MSLEVFYEKLLKVFYCSETSASLAVHSRSYSSVLNVFYHFSSKISPRDPGSSKHCFPLEEPITQ